MLEPIPTVWEQEAEVYPASRSGQPWMGFQVIIERQPTIHTQNHTYSLAHMFLDSGKKPEYPEKIYANTNIQENMQTPQRKPRTNQSETGPSCYDVALPLHTR